MSGPEVRSLEEWKEWCRRRETGEGGSRQSLLRTGWAGSDITPPPSLETPVARTPLDRAEECERRADEADGAEGEARWLREALAWLDHPHPDSSPPLLRAIARRKAELRSRLEAG